MTGKILRFSLFLAVIAGTAFGSPAAGIKGLGRAEAQAGELSEAQYLELLAETEGVSAASLELADVGTLELIDGSTVTRVKALDRTTHAAVGASFRDGKAVDEEALKATVTAAWREAHGRLTYPLVEKLTNSLPDETFTVSVWLIAEIEPLPKPSDEAAQQPAIEAPSTANPVDLGAAAKPSSGGKVIEKPLRLEQVPPEVLKALAGALPEAPVSDSAEKTRTEVDKNAALGG